MIVEIVEAVLFGILALAVIAWIAIVIPEFKTFLRQHKRLFSVASFVFNAAPAQDDARKTYQPVGFVIERIIPIILWLLIIVPMFVFPIILIIFPLLHIPWSYLLPPTP
jgi:hypothetical protein